MTAEEFLRRFRRGELAIDFTGLTQVEDAGDIIRLLWKEDFEPWDGSDIASYIASKFIASSLDFRFLICDQGGRDDMVAVTKEYDDYFYEGKYITWEDLAYEVINVPADEVSESDFDSILGGDHEDVG